MKLFERQKDNENAPPVPPELEPYYEDQGTSERNWTRIIPIAVITLIVIALIVLLIVWLTGGFSSNGAKPKATPSVGTTTPQQKSPSRPKNTSGAGQPSATMPNGASQTAPNSGKGGNLSNTGPGSTIALFIGGSAVGAVVYELRLRRRTATNQGR